MPYQKRREQLCINGEALRVPLLQSSIRMESFIPLKYVGGEYDRDGKTWCWDCSFGAYYCIKCCNELHRLKQWFYSPPALKVSVFRIFKLTKLISKLWKHLILCGILIVNENINGYQGILGQNLTGYGISRLPLQWSPENRSLLFCNIVLHNENHSNILLGLNVTIKSLGVKILTFFHFHSTWDTTKR